MSAGLRVLHVDDDPAQLELTAAYLEKLDADLQHETAGGAEEALTRLATESFDCVVSDYDMPDTNGLELLETVRERHEDLPFILFTGKGSEEIASEAIAKGVTEYLQKGSGLDHYRLLVNRITTAVERYRERRALAETEERYRSLVDNLPTAVVVHQRGEIVYVNDATVDLVGADSPEEVVGTNLLEHLAPGDRDAIRERIRVLHEDPDAEPLGWISVEVLHEEAGPRPVRAIGIPVSYDGDPAVQVVVRVESVASDPAEDHERTRAVLAAANVPALVVEDTGTVAVASDALLDRLDADRSAVEGEPLAALAAAPADDSAPAIAPDEDVAALADADGEPVSVALEAPTADRDPVGLALHPVRGEPPAILGVLEDWATSGAGTAAELRRQTERMEAVASTLNHDLRNPLSIATGHLEYARESGDLEHLEDVAVAHDRIGALLDDVVALARQGQPLADPASHSLAELAERAVETVQVDAPSLSLGADCEVVGDRDRLLSLLEECVRNAVEHGEATTVYVGALEDGDGFSVADDGTGVPEGDHAAVLDPGYTTLEEGNGMGLAIVEAIAAAHGYETAATPAEEGGLRLAFERIRTADEVPAPAGDSG